MFAQQLENIRKLEHQKIISIGMDRNATNNYFYRISLWGKLLNWGTILLNILIIVFLFVNWRVSIQICLFVCFYALFVHKVATTTIRWRAINNETLFDLLYNARVITIRDNTAGHIYDCFNSHWAQVSDTIMDRLSENNSNKKMHLAEMVIDAQNNPHKYDRSNFPD